jgi:hypothetical protein
MLLLILLYSGLYPCSTVHTATVQQLTTSESQRHLIGAPGSQGVSRQAHLRHKLPDNRGAVGSH